LLPIWRTLFGKGLFMLPPKEWRRTHKIALRGIGSRHTALFYPGVYAVATATMSSIELLCEKTKEVQLVRATKAFALEAVCRIAFGLTDTTLLEEVSTLFSQLLEPDLPKSKTLLSRVQGFLPYVLPSYYSHTWLFSDARVVQERTKKLHNFAAKIVQSEREHKDASKRSDGDGGGDKRGGVGDSTLLKVLCAAEDEEEGSLSEEEVVHNVFSFMAAGWSTTSDTVLSALIQIALHPEVQARLVAEIDSVEMVAEGGKKQEGQEAVAWEAVNECVYLSMVVKETLRLYPAVLALPPRVATERFDIGDVIVPKGGMVYTNNLVNARRTSTWGPDACVFRPSRFEPVPTEGSTTDAASLSGAELMDYDFTTFGGGVRSTHTHKYTHINAHLHARTAYINATWDLLTFHRSLAPLPFLRSLHPHILNLFLYFLHRPSWLCTVQALHRPLPVPHGDEDLPFPLSPPLLAPACRGACLFTSPSSCRGNRIPSS
jgi:cytochrome P450